MVEKISSSNGNLITQAIPMQIIKKEVAKFDPDFKARSKQGYIDKLKEKNSQQLEDLSIYYSFTRERRLFICKLNNKYKQQLKDVNDFLDKLGKLKHKQRKGVIYEVKNISYNPSEKMIFFKIIIHSDLKKFSKEKPTMDGNYSLDYREKNFTVNLLHLSPICLEVRTGLRAKVDLSLEFLNNELFQDVNAFQVYHLIDEEKKKLAGTEGLKYKEAIMEELSLEGCDQITLKGEDVESTLKYFKESHIDLVKLAKRWKKSKIETANQQFKFDADGKVSIKRKLENPFKLILEVIFKDEK